MDVNLAHSFMPKLKRWSEAINRSGLGGSAVDTNVVIDKAETYSQLKLRLFQVNI